MSSSKEALGCLAATSTDAEDAHLAENGNGPARKKRRLEDPDQSEAYRNGLFLAPMYGASLVWGPEIVDRAIIDAQRTTEPSGVVRFVKDGRSVWETHPFERRYLIYQIGSAHVDQALEAAKKVQDLVAGIGLNASSAGSLEDQSLIFYQCGCPKSFSVHGGMGAELLKVPDKLCAVRILRNLVKNVSVPVSCKIRLLPDQADTIALVKRIVETGIVQLTVHCRTQDMRPREPALLHRLREIVEAVVPYGVPVAANGDCFKYEDIEGIKSMTGVTSIMLARGAERNISVFRPEGPLDPVDEVIPRYLRVARNVSQPWHNCKYVLQCADIATSPVSRPKKQRNAIAQRYLQAKTLDDACRAFDIDVSQQSSLEELLPNLSECSRASEGDAPRSTTARPVGISSSLAVRCAPSMPLDAPIAEVTA